MTSEKRKTIIQAIGDKAREITPQGTEVILFGSQARSEAHPDSDWDILVLLDKEKITRDDVNAYSYPFWELGWDFNETINAILYTKKEWNRNKSRPFYENVTEDGIRIWG